MDKNLIRILNIILFVVLLNTAWAQDVVVNEYYNTNDQRSEWTELVIIKDNLDLTGWFFGDNNQDTDSWQPKFTFKNHSLWKNLRAGTIITIDHAATTTDCDDPLDVDKSDGYIRVCTKIATYFSGGSSTTLHLADPGDFVHIVDPSGKHIHGIGHDDDPGTSVEGGNCFTTSTKWTNTNTAQGATRPCGNFLYYRFQMTAPQSLFVNTGTLADFSAGMQSSASNAFIKLSDTPFLGIGNPGANSPWIVNLRAPAFTADTICYSHSSDNTINFTWPAAVDPNPSDGTVGYLVLRNLTGDFASPSPGIEYQVGNSLGSGNQTATVVAVITNSQTTSFSENIGPGSYSYRIYVFRYKNTPSFSHFTRGRTYNTSQFIQANAPGNVQVSVENDTLCAPGIVTLRVKPSTSASVNWFESATGGQPIATGDSLRLLVNQSKSYWAEVSSSATCAVQRFEVKATIQPLMVDVTGPDSVCIGVEAVFPVKSSDGIWYEYHLTNPPAGARDSLGADSTLYFVKVPEYPEGKTLTYTIQAHNREGCSSAILSRNISTRVFNPQLKATPFDPEVGDLVEITLDSAYSFGTFSNWENFGGTLISTGFAKATFKTEDTAVVSVTICRPSPLDGCECIVKRSVAINPVVPSPPGVIPSIPNLILPDGRSSNQTLNFQGYEVKSLEIFDRWGKKVYQSSPYKNDWKGDDVVPGATYFYKAEVKETSKTAFETVSGWVQIFN